MFIFLQTLTINAAKTVNNLLYLGFNIFELFIICLWCDEIRVQVSLFTVKHFSSITSDVKRMVYVTILSAEVELAQHATTASPKLSLTHNILLFNKVILRMN